MIFLLMAGALVAHAESAPRLRFDPFRALPKVVPQPTRTAANSPADAFVPVLRSTVVAGEKSLVNLGGEILAVGDEVEGYRLLEVHPFAATFSKDGDAVTLTVDAGEGEGR